MKKLLALLLAMTLFCAAAPVGAGAESAEWTYPTESGLTMETLTLFTQATNNLVGIIFQPLELLAVRGTAREGCCFLCKGFLTGEAAPFYALVYVDVTENYVPRLLEIQRLEVGLLPDDTEAAAPAPTAAPTAEPTEEPTVEPTEEPTEEPTAEPTAEPTEEPTAEPTAEPTEEPTAEPTAEPTEEPTAEPTAEPTEEPTAEPTAEPTEEPTAEPTAEPTEEPTAEPTAEPTEEPTAEPTEEPTPIPDGFPRVADYIGEYFDLSDGMEIILRLEAANTEGAALLTVEWPTGDTHGYRYKLPCVFDPEALTFTYEDGQKDYWIELVPGSVSEAIMAIRLSGNFSVQEDGTLSWDASGNIPESNCRFTLR